MVCTAVAYIVYPTNRPLRLGHHWSVTFCYRWLSEPSICHPSPPNCIGCRCCTCCSASLDTNWLSVVNLSIPTISRETEKKTATMQRPNQTECCFRGDRTNSDTDKSATNERHNDTRRETVMYNATRLNASRSQFVAGKTLVFLMHSR